MKILESEMIVMTDIDDTLVMWDRSFHQPGENKVRFVDPYDLSVNYLTPHQKHIDLIKKYKGRGMTVIAWSAGGYAWAKSVIETLELQEYIDLVMSKPIKYIDDLNADEILGSRVYLENK